MKSQVFYIGVILIERDKATFDTIYHVVTNAGVSEFYGYRSLPAICKSFLSENLRLAYTIGDGDNSVTIVKTGNGALYSG